MEQETLPNDVNLEEILNLEEIFKPELLNTAEFKLVEDAVNGDPGCPCSCGHNLRVTIPCGLWNLVGYTYSDHFITRSPGGLCYNCHMNSCPEFSQNHLHKTQK